MLRTGVDMIEVARIERALTRFGDRFLRRCFTEQERADCAGRAGSLAARFAGKEAVMKALGHGLTEVDWRDIEIVSGSNRQPDLRLHGTARRYAERQGLREWAISLSHTHEHAIACVVAQ
jgi:holo-[acyl-carrier protein] synthase